MTKPDSDLLGLRTRGTSFIRDLSFIGEGPTTLENLSKRSTETSNRCLQVPLEVLLDDTYWSDPTQPRLRV